MAQGEVLIEVRDLVKDFHGLRPLRIGELILREGQSVALLGLDRAMAEVLVNLITGATVPDTGTVSVFGDPTTSIRTADAWMSVLDRFGLISERAVLVERFTAEQNLAMPLSLEIEDMPAPLRQSARQLAKHARVPEAELGRPTGALPAASQLRIRLGRAIAMDPQVLLAEHPNALTSEEDVLSFAGDYKRVVSDRRLASLVMTADRSFAAAVGGEVLVLEPATGALKPLPGWRRWFR
jgi:ABC-type lipoprotein export system ATPase subunit